MQCLQTGRRCFTNRGEKPAGPRLAVGCVGGVGLKQTFTLLGVVSQWPLAHVRSNVLDVRFRRQCGRRVSYWPTSAMTQPGNERVSRALALRTSEIDEQSISESIDTIHRRSLD
jgi:hypothetical protein